jgi:hypothetical protein
VEAVLVAVRAFLFFFFSPLLESVFAHSRHHNDPAPRETVRKAYKLALNHIAQDKDSGEIWSDYIKILKTAEVIDFSLCAILREC